MLLLGGGSLAGFTFPNRSGGVGTPSGAAPAADDDEEDLYS